MIEEDGLGYVIQHRIDVNSIEDQAVRRTCLIIKELMISVRERLVNSDTRFYDDSGKPL